MKLYKYDKVWGYIQKGSEEQTYCDLCKELFPFNKGIIDNIEGKAVLLCPDCAWKTLYKESSGDKG